MNESKVILKAKIIVEGKILALTGLHIGGSSTELSIGGADLVVVRNPFDNIPYIPGSSLKGKMRSLLEKSHNLELKDIARIKMHLCDKEEEPCPICTVFGLPGNYKNSTPTRLYVRDGRLLNDDLLEKLPGTDMPYTEVKTEVAIDRITSAANPRNIERVPAGAEFGLSLIFNLFEGDELEHMDLVWEGLKLVEDDYLGGHGSRGYGQVEFQIEGISIRKASYYKGEDEEVWVPFDNWREVPFSQLLEPYLESQQKDGD